mmetsp:Transcript_61389/g.155048  ORF Transcript_61389/g.155048 Transcript_61389/m.155048 type:complete len:107 (-) Transcript_61389:20-340(-)
MPRRSLQQRQLRLQQRLHACQSDDCRRLQMISTFEHDKTAQKLSESEVAVLEFFVELQPSMRNITDLRPFFRCSTVSACGWNRPAGVSLCARRDVTGAASLGNYSL